MKEAGIVRQPEIFYQKCPYCQNQLGIVAYHKRRVKKRCVCDKCGKVIDERFVKY